MRKYIIFKPESIFFIAVEVVFFSKALSFIVHKFTSRKVMFLPERHKQNWRERETQHKGYLASGKADMN